MTPTMETNVQIRVFLVDDPSLIRARGSSCSRTTRARASGAGQEQQGGRPLAGHVTLAYDPVIGSRPDDHAHSHRGDELPPAPARAGGLPGLRATPAAVRR